MSILYASTLVTLAYLVFLYFIHDASKPVKRARWLAIILGTYVVEAAREHFAELKDNQLAMVHGEGYGVLNRSEWENEVERFLRLVVSPKVSKHLLESGGQSVLNDLGPRMIDDLVSLDALAENFDVERYVDDILVPTRKVHLDELTRYGRWGFGSAFILIGVLQLRFAASSGYWPAGIAAVVAGCVLIPPVAHRFIGTLNGKLAWNIKGLGATLITFGVPLLLSFVSNGAQLRYESIKQDERFAHEEMLQAEKARRAQLWSKLQAEKLRDENEKEARKRADEVARLKQEFAARKEEIMRDMSGLLAKGDLRLSGDLVAKYGAVGDAKFDELRAQWQQKNEAFQANEAAERAAKERQASYAAKIRDYALSPYTKDTYPKTVAKFGSQLPEIEKLRRRAAEMAIDSGKCDSVELVEVSDKATRKEPIFFIDCTNEQRIYLKKSEILAQKPVLTQQERAVPEDQALDMCERAARSKTRHDLIPSSLDFHRIMGQSVRTVPQNGNVVVRLEFDGKNAFNAEYELAAHCIITPDRTLEINVGSKR